MLSRSASAAQPFSLLRRIGRRTLRELRKPFKPILERLRDRQAPALHRWMMHEASVPMTATGKSALVIAPHHDDETFGCGGMIALKRDAGAAVHVLVMTDGRQSHGHIPGVDPDRIEETRKAELMKACAILGVPDENVLLFDLPDQGVYRLSEGEREAAVRRLADLIGRLRPQELFVNCRNDRHPDHEAVFKIVSEAIATAGVPLDVYEYPIWLIWKGPYRWTRRPDDLRGAGRVDVRGVQDRKDRAIAAYESQHAILPAGFLGQFTQGYELFFRKGDADST